jgi:hypothetical protein
MYNKCVPKKMGLELNGKHYLLVYADYVTLLSGK